MTTHVRHHAKPNVIILPIAGAAYTCTWAIDIVPVTGIPLFAAFSIISALFLAAIALCAGKLARPTAIDHLIGLFMLWIILSCAWSSDTASSVRMVYYYALSFLLFIQIEHTTNPAWAWRNVAWAFVLGAITANILILAQAILTGVDDNYRGAIGAINANYLAYSLATAIPIIFALALSPNSSFINNKTAILLSFFLIVGIMVTGSRSGLLAAIAGLGTHLLLHLRRNLFVVLGAILAFGLGLLLFYDFLPEGLRTRLDLISLISERGQNVNSNLSGRLDVWPLAIEYFKTNPIGGIGIGAFPAVNPFGFGAHNLPLSLAAEVGLIGLALYLIIIAAIATQTILKAPTALRSTGLTLFMVWIPIVLSGMWESVPTPWVAFALTLTINRHSTVPQMRSSTP